MIKYKMESNTLIELLFCVRVDILNSDEIIIFSEMFESVSLKFSDEASFRHDRALKNYIFFNCLIDEKQLRNNIFLEMSFKDETAKKLGAKEKTLTFKSNLDDLVYSEIKTETLNFSLFVLDPHIFPKLKTLKYLTVDDVIFNYENERINKKIEFEKSEGTEIQLEKSKKNKNKKKKKNKKKEQIPTIQKIDEVEISNDNPSLNEQIPQKKNSSEETSPSNIESTDFSTCRNLRKMSKENSQSIHQNLMEINLPENYQKNNLQNSEEFINLIESKSSERSENKKPFFEEMIKELAKKLDETNKELAETNKKLAETNKELNSHETKLNLIFKNLSCLNTMFSPPSAIYYKYLNK